MALDAHPQPISASSLTPFPHTWHCPRAFSIRPEYVSSSRSRSGAVRIGADPTVHRSAGRVDTDDDPTDDDADDDDAEDEADVEEAKSIVGAGVGAMPSRTDWSSDAQSCNVCGMQRRRGSPCLIGNNIWHTRDSRRKRAL